MSEPAAVDELFRPPSVAVVGASEDFVRINGRPLKFLLDKGYAGRVFPVNPKHTTLAGLPCCASVSAVPEPGDLAIVAVPASSVAAPLLDVLVAVSHLGMDAGGAIRELDINPLVVLEEGQGALGVDALVVLDIERCP